MNLTQSPEFRNWPATHYIYIEKIGPFQETAQAAWTELHKLIPELSKSEKLNGFFSLYKVDPKRMVYRAGVSVDRKPENLPSGLSYTLFEGGKYVCFTLTGPYDQLPEACGYAFRYVEEKNVPRRDAFNIENYVSDPKTTAAEKCVTEIMIATT